jgi:uncharacterized membrane protein (DUF485 family)
MPDTPRRVTVTSSRPVRHARGRSSAPLAEVQEQTALGGVLLRSLVRAQLLLGIGVILAFSAIIAALPLLFALNPQFLRRSALGLPLPLLVVGVLIYPLVIVTGWIYVRRAERNEREFEELVRQS